MQSTFRLKENRDFRRVFQRGKSVATHRFAMHWFLNREGHVRVGFSVSKKVGNAVVRNGLKRRLRECFIRHLDLLREQSMDIVVVCRKPSADANFDEIYGDVLKLLKRAKFMV